MISRSDFREVYIRSARRFAHGAGPTDVAEKMKGGAVPDTLNSRVKTILVVDNDERVRELVVGILESEHYHVLSSDSAKNAISLSEETKGPIDLLLTEWDMPSMSGIALGQALKAVRPDLHVMHMSGGERGSLLILNYGWAVLQKDLLPTKLAEMVRDVLTTVNRSQLGGESFDSRLDTNLSPAMAKNPDAHPADSNEPKDRGK